MLDRGQSLSICRTIESSRRNKMVYGEDRLQFFPIVQLNGSVGKFLELATRKPVPLALVVP